MTRAIFLLLLTTIFFSGCSSVYYAGMEKIGVHKRDIMVSRVESVKESQQDAQEEFSSALERFGDLVHIEDSELKSAYESYNDQYQDASDAAEDVTDNIDKLESVSLALFDEWEGELLEYKNMKLKLQSQKKLRDTKAKYSLMMKSMRKSQKSMNAVLATFYDNVLTLKHSLNAQAVGALKNEFKTLKGDMSKLMREMNLSIKESDKFIKQMN